MRHSRFVISALLLLMIPGIATAGLKDRLKLPDVKVPEVKIPGLESLMGNDDPVISTSIADALTEITYLDDYTPREPIPLDVLRPNSEGTFKLFPGVFEFDAQSYCMHAGTYGPSDGDGYLYAPLKGSKSSIIRSLLKQSVNHPEIPQENVQTLIWAVLARTNINKMTPEDRKTASKLLTKDEIKDLQGSALDVIPEDTLSGILDSATEPIRRVLEAENSLREKLTDATSSYDELEEVAVLEGEHPKGKNSREVPKGRWSYHPDGYFVRYIPRSYTDTHIEVYVPERFVIERDAQGRIKSVADRNGSSIELTYDDTIQLTAITGDTDVSAYAFKSVRFVEKLPGIKPEDVIERKWDDKGWAFVGIPNGKGSVKSSAARFSGLSKRYAKASSLVKDFDDTTSRVIKAVGAKATPTQSTLQDMTDLSHLRTALAEMMSKEDLGDNWTANHLDRITNAWQSAFYQRINNIQVAALPEAMIGLIGASSDGPAFNGAGFSPGGGVASPGDTAQQRLAQSGRPSRDCGNSDDDGTGSALQDAFKKHGMDVSDENLDIRESGSGNCRMIRFHIPLGEGGKPLPKLGCMQGAIAGGSVPEGSLESPKKILFGSVQQCGDETMVNMRTTDLETGEVTGAGRGRSNGTGDSSTSSAAGDALGGLGL